MTNNRYYKDSYKDNINDFIDCLNAWQKESGTCEQFYRGQPIMEELKPSLFRDNVNQKLMKFIEALKLDPEIWDEHVYSKCEDINNLLGSKCKKTLSDQQRNGIQNLILRRYFEQFLLTSFFKIANGSGLNVNYSGIHSKLHYINSYKPQPMSFLLVDKKVRKYPSIPSDYLADLLVNGDESLCNLKNTPLNRPELKFIATIAQHHGIQTRLLDFTRSALKATFFACYHADIRSDIDTNDNQLIAVYRVRVTDKKKSMINFITENDHYLNKFLFAQEGLFAILFGDRYFIDHQKWPSIEDLSEKYGGLEVERITFPRTKTWELLKYLKTAHNISISKLMPHYNYVAEELKMHLENISDCDNFLDVM